MNLEKPDGTRHVAEHTTAAVFDRRAFAVRQGARLAIGSTGLAGGAFLLATNVAATLTTAGASIPWIPLSGNLALVFGSVMFLREYRRASR